MKKNLRSRHPAGFMLLETVVSALLLAVALVSLVGAINNDIQAGMYVRDRSTAMFLAEAIMAEMENQLLWKKEAYGFQQRGTFDPPNDKFSWEVEIESDEEVAEHHVTVVVEWELRGKTKNFWLYTIFPMERSDEDLK